MPPPVKPLIDKFLASVERGLQKPLAKHPDYLVVKKDQAVAARDFIENVNAGRARTAAGRANAKTGPKIKRKDPAGVRNREAVGRFRAKQKGQAVPARADVPEPGAG